jgi:hypothetical protein
LKAGIGAPQNPEEGERWINLSIQRADVLDRQQIALVFEVGIELPPNADEAKKWLEGRTPRLS